MAHLHAFSLATFLSLVIQLSAVPSQTNSSPLGTTVDASLWGVLATLLIPHGFADYSAMPEAAQRSASGHADMVIAAYGNKEYIAQFAEKRLIEGAKLILIRGEPVGSPGFSRQEFAQRAAELEQRMPDSNSKAAAGDLNALLSPEMTAVTLAVVKVKDRAIGSIELQKVSTPVLNNPNHLMLQADVGIHIKDRVLNVMVIEPCFGRQSLDDVQNFIIKYSEDLISVNP
jgi:hypothetical protein